MFIQTEATPNPATLKFLPGRVVMAAGTADFPSAESAARSPLAQALFAVGGVTGVAGVSGAGAGVGMVGGSGSQAASASAAVAVKAAKRGEALRVLRSAAAIEAS